MASRTRRRDSSGHVDPYVQRRRRYEAVLGPMGLWALFAAMPRYYQEQFWKAKAPDPQVVFDATVTAGPEHRAMREAVEAGLRAATFDAGGGTTMTVRDHFGVVTGCMLVARHTVATNLPDEVRRFIREAGPRLERAFAEQNQPAMRAMHHAALVSILPHSRTDVRLLAARLELRAAANGKVVPQVVVTAADPQARRVTVGGAARPMYRVAETHGSAGIEWLSWTAADLGRATATAPPGGYPVYVQSHALRQLRDRVNLPAAAPYVEAWLAEALAKPNVVERTREGDLLVEFRLKEHRVGYLVVTPLADLVAVRTFLFLTMDPTPEARLLNTRLRLTRRDVAWLGLHDLAAFTQTDLRDDEVLRPLLAKCGCGHLFALADDADFAPDARPTPLAAEVRRYLRLAA